MSETTTSVSRPKSNVLTKPMGPLPMWGWMAIIGGLALLYSFYKKSNASSNTTSTDQSAGGVNAPGGVDASLVPQFINQTYNQETPPPAPNVTVNNTVPIPPTGGTQPTPPPNIPPKPVPVSKYNAPTGLVTSKVSGTSLKVMWNNITNQTPPASYTVAIYSKAGKLLQQSTVNAPDATGGKSTTTITGLPANSQGLQVHVWANGGTLAPPHASSTLNI